MKFDSEILEKLIQDSPIGMVLINELGDIVFINQMLLELFGYDETELLGESVDIFVPDEFKEGHLDKVKKYFVDSHKRMMGIGLDLKGLRKNGSEFDVEVGLNPIEHQGEKFVLGTVNDISSKKAKDDLIKSNEKLLQSIMTEINDGYWDWDLGQDGQGTDEEYLSPGFKKMFGYEDHEIENKASSWQKIIFPEDLELAIENFNKHIQTDGKHPFYQEVRYKHKNGKTIWVICRGKAIKDPATGIYTRMIGTHTDITSLKELESELQESKLRFSLAVESSVSGIWDWEDVSKEDEWWSPMFYETLGYKVGELDPCLGSFKELLHPDDHEKTFEAVNECFLKDHDFNVEYRLKNKNGEYRWYKGKAVLVRNEKGDPLRMVGTITDIHDRVVFEKSLESTNEELENFAYRTSHDLKSPLSTIAGLCELAKLYISTNEYDQLEDLMQRIQKSSKKLSVLITDILDLCRSKTLDENQTEIDLEMIINQIVGDLEVTLDAKSKVEFILEFNHDNKFYSQQTRLYQVLQNLISNSIKYRDKAKDRCFVKVISKNISDGSLQINIEDNGIGFPKGYKEKVFDMFSRFHKESADGSGLGLYIVSKNIEKLKARIELETEEGLGAKFSLFLPQST